MKTAKVTYQQRLEVLCQTMMSGQLLFIGNKETPRNFGSNCYKFRQDSSFLYYFGIAKPGLNVLVDVESGTATLFGDDPTIDDTVWIGEQKSLKAIAETCGISSVKNSAELSKIIKGDCHYLPPYKADHKLQIAHLLGSKEKPTTPSLSFIKAVIAQRSYKTELELSEMDLAASISNDMHREVIRRCRPGLKEYDLVAIANKIAYESNTELAYQPIMTINGQILHTNDYTNELKENDMVLFDGGVEVKSGYCADLTRTFPVGKNFSPLQRDLYILVDKTYKHGVDLARPGTSYKDIHLSCAQVLVDGLKDIGWMKGNSDSAVEAGAHTMFFQCGLGHMIGLDVHDMENLGEQYVGYDHPHLKSTEFGLKSLRLAKPLEEGFCITIEPGIYVIPQLIDKLQKEQAYTDFIAYEKLNAHRDFGGIRIEDDFVITANGNSILGNGLSTDIDVIEALGQETIA